MTYLLTYLAISAIAMPFVWALLAAAKRGDRGRV